jgi:hypothetical protein
MATKGAIVAVTTFTRYEEYLIKQIDQNSDRRREFVIKTTEALRFTTCSTITRKRKQVHRKRLMN